jgi:hypothetical protein
MDRCDETTYDRNANAAAVAQPDSRHRRACGSGGQPERVEKALTAIKTTRVALTEQAGAGEHTHAGGLARAKSREHR